MFTQRKCNWLTALGLLGLAAGGTSLAAPVPAGNEFHISGSTALDNQVKDALLLPSGVGGACSAGTISVYTDAPVISNGLTPATYTPNLKKSHQAVIVCQLANPIGTLAAGTVVAFNKESNGGSNEGTYYPAAQAALSFLDLTQNPVGCTQVAGAAIAPNLPANVAAGFYWTHQQQISNEFDGCTGPIVSAIPEVGLADEDPALFNLGPQAISSALIGQLNTTPLFQNQFAVAVSLNLYRALQRAQGLPLDDILADMPSLTREQIAGIYSGLIGSWAQVLSPTGAAINAAAYTAGKTIANQVYVCRRGDNSGTNVSADVFFLRNRCNYTISPSTGLLTAVAGTTMTGVTTTVANCGALSAGQTPENNGCHWAAVNLADTVFGGAAGGDVASCLDAHSRDVPTGTAGTNQTDTNTSTFAIGHLGATSTFDDALGVEATTNPTGKTVVYEAGTNHWRYISIGGAKPTVLSMANGTYDYAFDNVENLWTGLAGNALAVGNFLGTLFQSTVALSDILVAQPNAKSLAAGNPVDGNYITGGLVDAAIAAALVAPPVTAAGVVANPASALTFDASGTVNNCQVPLPSGNVLSKEVF